MLNRLLLLGLSVVALPAALHAAPKDPAPPTPVPVPYPLTGALVLSNLTWTNQCSSTGSGGLFFPTCASASLNLYDNGWMELLFWNRAGFGGTFADAAVKAIGLGGLGAPTGSQGASNGWDAGFGGNRIGWAPETDIQGPNNGNGFKANGNPEAFCSGFAISCPGGITTPYAGINGGGSASFYWYAGTGLTSLDANTISLQLHSGSGPNGWSTGYLCLSDGAGGTVVEGNVTWGCEEDGLGGPAEVTPEPATMTLIATGLAGMAAARRRRRAIK